AAVAGSSRRDIPTPRPATSRTPAPATRATSEPRRQWLLPRRGSGATRHGLLRPRWVRLRRRRAGIRSTAVVAGANRRRKRSCRGNRPSSQRVAERELVLVVRWAERGDYILRSGSEVDDPARPSFVE